MDKNQKKAQRSRGALLLGLAGLLLLIGGVILCGMLAETYPLFERLGGVTSGAGGALMGVGFSRFYQIRKLTPEQERRKEIERCDERNIQVNRAALCVVAAAGFIILGVLAVLFTVLDYGAAGIICSAAVFVLIAVYLVAYRRLSAKM